MRFFAKIVVALMLAGSAMLPRLEAFSLLGPASPWQTHRLGYDVSYSLNGNFAEAPFAAGFGPMNLGEEYRYNVPTVYYAFTHDFLTYFGQRGAQEIDKAMKILNELPAISKMNIDDYPLASVRINHRAQALGLLDLKSTALNSVLFQLGVADPTRFVFTLRKRWTFPTCPPLFFFVVRRNFDPDTWSHSTFVNGDLWTYNTIIDTCTPPPDFSLLVTEPVDPLALLGLRHAPVAATRGARINGGFFTTLTRDDVAALKYIYSPSNYNVENLPPGTTNSLLGAVLTGGTPWGVPTWFLTNGVVTNVFGGGGAGGTNLFEPGLRGGIDKVNFVRAEYDSYFGSFFAPVTNAYTDTIVISNQAVRIGSQRVLVTPDIVFDAGDLEGPAEEPAPVGATLGAFAHIVWDNNQDVNGLSSPDTQYGPGTISPATGATPGFVLTFNKVGPINGNQWPFFVSEADSIASGFGPETWILWGSFDGSTNEPVVYPHGTSIRELESLVLRGN